MNHRIRSLIKNGKFINIVAIRCQILITKCTKIEIGWGFAPDPTGGAHDAPQPLVEWEGDTPSPYPSHRRLHPRAFGARSASILAPSALDLCAVKNFPYIKPCVGPIAVNTHVTRIFIQATFRVGQKYFFTVGSKPRLITVRS